MAAVGGVNIGSASDVINALNGIIQTNITYIVVTFVMAATFLLLLKTLAEALTGYIQLRLDQHLAIGSLVEVYGKVGFIKQVSIFTVTIETEYEFIRVPTKRWRLTKFLILKGCGPIPERRKSDKKKKDKSKIEIKKDEPKVETPVVAKVEEKIKEKRDIVKPCACKFTDKI